MKRAIAIALALGLLGAALVGPAQAGKKKLKPSSSRFFLHWDAPPPGGGDCDGMRHMNLEDTQGDINCQKQAQIAQEILIASGSEPLSHNYPASAGVPLTLDASRKITGEFYMRTSVAVQAYVEWVLAGTTGGRSVEIASGKTEVYNAGPVVTTLKFEGQASKKLDKKTFSSIDLTTTVRGYAEGGVSRDNPGSFVTVPTYK